MAKTTKARSEYTCFECGITIKKGTSYVSEQIYEGDNSLWTHRACVECHDLLKHVSPKLAFQRCILHTCRPTDLPTASPAQVRALRERLSTGARERAERV